LLSLRYMSSKYVLANIEMPIEITHDNKIIPLQNLSCVRVVSIIDSIADIKIDKTIPDIITQSTLLFNVHNSQNTSVIEPTVALPTEPDEHNEVDPTHEHPIEETDSTDSTHRIPLIILPEELRKTPSPFKKNTSFKNRSNYSHRNTAKHREPM
jgi:hypothetical protein